jgi:hypothetical protein
MVMQDAGHGLPLSHSALNHRPPAVVAALSGELSSREKGDRMGSNRISGRRALPLMEAVENRLFCDGSFGTAVSLGSVAGLVVKLDHVDGGANQKDFYKLTTALTGRLRVSLDAISGGDVDLYLYNSSQGQIFSSTLDGTASELIDLNSEPAGTYYVEVRHFSGGTTNYTLGVQTDFAGNGFGSVRQAGAIGTVEKTFKDFIGNSDKDDYYKFNTTANGVVTLKLDGLTSDVDIQLYNSAGTLVKSSINAGSGAELIYHGSAAATYYARVFQFTSTSNYTLHLSNAAVPADNAGNNMAAAKNLGTIGITSANDWIVNKFDHDDFYKIFVAQPGDIGISLYGLKADLNVDIEDNLGNIIAKSTKTGTQDEVFQVHSNFGGTYYVRVYQGGTIGAAGSSSSYNLSLGANTDTAGNNKASATNVQLFQGSATRDGFVGVNDPEDWYKVTITAGKSLHGTISNLTADADIELYNSAGTRLDFSTNNGTASDTVDAASLAAGTYYFRVLKFSNFNVSYKLTITTT